MVKGLSVSTRFAEQIFNVVKKVWIKKTAMCVNIVSILPLIGRVCPYLDSSHNILHNMLSLCSFQMMVSLNF